MQGHVGKLLLSFLDTCHNNDNEDRDREHKGWPHKIVEGLSLYRLVLRLEMTDIIHKLWNHVKKLHYFPLGALHNPR